MPALLRVLNLKSSKEIINVEGPYLELSKKAFDLLKEYKKKFKVDLFIVDNEILLILKPKKARKKRA